MPLLPHHKLDWNLARLEKQLDAEPTAETRLEIATLCWSRGWYHDGGDAWFERALDAARKVFLDDPQLVAARAVAAGALLGLRQIDAARTVLQQATTEPGQQHPLLHLVSALWHQAARRDDPGRDAQPAVREAEAACRLAPDAWEPHALLSELLAELATGPMAARRRERSEFHAVRALELGAVPPQETALLFHLGTSSVAAGRLDAASKLFGRLLEDEGWKGRAQYWLGVVNHQYGRYKNAVLYLRQHLDGVGSDGDRDSPRVHARLAMAYLELGELAKAADAAQRALSLDPGDAQARWTLGCAAAADGRPDDAIRAFKAILEDAPDHLPSFEALVRLHRAGDAGIAWLRAALRAEVKGYDRLPVSERRADGGRADGGGAPLRIGPKAQVFPRAAVRKRIEVVLGALREAGSSDESVATLLDAMDLTTDETLRFLLWETALDHVGAGRARAVIERVKTPGAVFSAELGREVLALAPQIPEELLVRGLQIDEEDLKRAAVDRGGPARDVADHRKAVDAQRREARAWQALLLLAIASQGPSANRNLLVRWAAEADPDLGDAARAALVMLGDDEATAALTKRARARGAQNLVEAMVAQVATPAAQNPVRPLAPGEDRACTTCGRRSGDVAHMMVGGAVAVCNRCLAEIALHRRELETDDPEAVCALSGRGRFETAAMYAFQGLTISREVVDHGLGLLEREAVDRFLDQL